MERLAVNPRTCSAWLGYLDSIMGVCQTIDLSTRTFLSESKVPIWLSEPAELAGRVMSGELPPPVLLHLHIVYQLHQVPFQTSGRSTGKLEAQNSSRGFNQRRNANLPLLMLIVLRML